MGQWEHNNIRIIRIPEREEKEQGIKNLFEEIMTENFPKEKRHISPGSAKSQIRWTQTGPCQRHIIIKMLKVKNKERLKSCKRKTVSYLQGSSHKAVHWFLNRNISWQKRLAWIIRSYRKQGPTIKTVLPSKAVI